MAFFGLGERAFEGFVAFFVLGERERFLRGLWLSLV